MKTLSLSLIAIIVSGRAAALPHPVSAAKKGAFARSLTLRGGDLGPISGSDIATTFSVLAAGDALFGAIATVEAWDKFGVTVERGTLGEHYMGHGIASSASSLAVTSFLATTGKTSTEHAIAYGFLARCAFMAEMLMNGRYKELGMPTTPFLTMWLILLATSFSLLSGNFDPLAASKIVSVVLSGHGALLSIKPGKGDDEDTNLMARFDGGYMFISSLFAALLAFGVDPVKAMGVAALGCIPLFVSVCSLVTVEELLGINMSVWKAALGVFIAACAYGMLN